MKILVINAGSSSLKYQFINMDDESVIAKGLCERIGIEGSRLKYQPTGKDEIIVEKPMKDHKDAITMVIDHLVDENFGVIKDMKEISAVGHRIVHGGEFFSSSVVIDDKVKEAISECAFLAPLHNPANLTGISACEEAIPGVKQVAVFDTAFHQTMPKSSYIYAIPYELYSKYKIRKYGFHGTSHKYVAQRTAKMLGKPLEDLKIVTAHLGNGSSVTGIKNGKSFDTSMGFTPLDGVVMGTRCGSIDPAIVMFLMENEKLNFTEINDVLNKQSGVFVIYGVRSDFRDLDDAVEQGNDRAKVALDVFAYSVTKYIAQFAAAMGGLDALVFTAGIGENNGEMRQKIVENLKFMGIELDPEKNKQRGCEIDITAPGAAVKTLVIPTNEELMIAKETQMLI